MVRFQVLGPLRVDGDVHRAPIRPAQRRLLHALLVDAGTDVSRDVLIDRLWGLDLPASAVNSLQAHVSGLRKVLGQVVVTSPYGYRLDVPPDQVDAVEFERTVERARAAALAGDWAEALGCADAARALWQGEPHQDVLDEPFVQPVVSRLRQRRQEVRLLRAEALVQLGRAHEAVGVLEQAATMAPQDEYAWELLMTALAAAGRRAEALQGFLDARAALAELGLEPGAALREVQQRILAEDATPVAPPGASPGLAHLSRVPAPRTPLVGRTAEVRRLAELLDTHRLVTVVGPGGAGKTRLATESARRREGPDEKVFVDLTRVRDGDEVVSTVAGAAGVRLVGDPDGLEAVLVERFRVSPTLLVLDNAEHVVAAVGHLVDLLLQQVETLVVLATSRRPLDVDGERLFPLGPMEPADAVTLFLDRADARRPGSAETADREVVRELCRGLDGLPLAIEIAAGQTAHLSVEEILATTLDRPHTLRRPGSGSDDDRHRSLRSTIAWSHELLPVESQVLLRHLGVFRGRFDPDQAAFVAPGDRDVREITDLLSDLVAHSLVVAEPDTAGTTYRLLDTLRAFAREELERRDELSSAEGRHRRWYVDWSRRLPPGAACMDTAVALTLARHQADLVAALGHADRARDVDALVDLAVLAAGLAFCPGGLAAAGRWVGTALDRAEALDGARHADLLAVGMQVAMLGDDVECARGRLRTALPLLEDHPAGVGPFALALGMADPRSAGTALRAAEELVARHGGAVRPDVRHAIASMRPVITAARSQDGARGLAEAEAAWAGRAWSDRATIATWAIHAALLHVNGRHRELRERLDGMEPTPPALGSPTYLASIFEALAAAGAGDRGGAMDRLRMAHALHWRGIPGIESDLVSATAVVHELTGGVARARQLLDRPGLRARHPGMAIVHLDCARRLGVPLGDYVTDWARGPDPQLAAVLVDALSSPGGL